MISGEDSGGQIRSSTLSMVAMSVLSAWRKVAVSARHFDDRSYRRRLQRRANARVCRPCSAICVVAKRFGEARGGCAKVKSAFQALIHPAVMGRLLVHYSTQRSMIEDRIFAARCPER